MYMEFTFLTESGDGYKTGVGAAMETAAATKAAFESYRSNAVDIKTAPFILDLHNENHDLLDSIAVSAETFKKISGQEVLSESEYKSYDDEFWREAGKNYAAR